MSTRGYGAWVERVDTSLWLYFFRPEIETAGFRRGSRNFCPNSNCALAPNPPRPFIWTVQGNVATVQFVGGITTLQLQLLQYDSATDTLEPPERVGLRRPSSRRAGTRISLGFRRSPERVPSRTPGLRATGSGRSTPCGRGAA